MTNVNLDIEGRIPCGINFSRIPDVVNDVVFEKIWQGILDNLESYPALRGWYETH